MNHIPFLSFFSLLLFFVQCFVRFSICSSDRIVFLTGTVMKPYSQNVQDISFICRGNYCNKFTRHIMTTKHSGTHKSAAVEEKFISESTHVRKMPYYRMFGYYRSISTIFHLLLVYTVCRIIYS